jgi:hypothetical protein
LVDFIEHVASLPYNQNANQNVMQALRDHYKHSSYQRVVCQIFSPLMYYHMPQTPGNVEVIIPRRIFYHRNTYIYMKANSVAEK